jgi:hypothetical protein
LRREAVEVWCFYFAAGGVERLHVAVAEVVGEDIDDVGLGGVGVGCGGGVGGREGEKEGKREGEKERRREREPRMER